MHPGLPCSLPLGLCPFSKIWGERAGPWTVQRKNMHAFWGLQLNYTPQGLSNLQRSPKRHDCCMSNGFQVLTGLLCSRVWEACSKPKILLLNFHSAKLYTYLWVDKLTLGLGSLIQGTWNSTKLYTKSWSELLQWTNILNALLRACPSSPSLQVMRETWETGLVED